MRWKNCLPVMISFAMNACGMDDGIPDSAVLCESECLEGRIEFELRFKAYSRLHSIYFVPAYELPSFADEETGLPVKALGVCKTRERRVDFGIASKTTTDSIVLVSENIIVNKPLLKHVIMHELGHAVLGLGHSSNPKDIMYAIVPRELMEGIR